MRRFIFVVIIAMVGAAVLAVGGIGVALALENQDPFCASCHTEPETTYYQRELQKNAGDLASFHSRKDTHCIDCHSGSGVLGRSVGLTQGANDLINYVAGKYHSPAITLNPLGDASCVKCHTNIFVRPPGRGRAGLGHYHFYLTQWQQNDPNAAPCISCHPPHTATAENLTFMSPGKVGQFCDECHSALSGVVK